jgi:hypothetical protein
MNQDRRPEGKATHRNRGWNQRGGVGGESGGGLGQWSRGYGGSDWGRSGKENG